MAKARNLATGEVKLYRLILIPGYSTVEDAPSILAAAYGARFEVLEVTPIEL